MDARQFLSRCRWILLPPALILALLSSPPASSQQSRPPAPDSQSAAPAVRVTTRLVQIGVVVHDKNGAVSGLTKNDFTVFDQRKPQAIDFFTIISPGSAAPPAERLPANTFSDVPRYSRAAPGSITIVLLDNLNSLYGSAPGVYEDTPFWMEDHALANAKAHLIEYLTGLAPQDRVAIYGLSRNLRVLCDFTTDRSQLLAIVKNYDARAQTSREIVDPAPTHLPNQPGGGVPPPIYADQLELAGNANAVRGEATMAALKAIADHVAGIPGRKNLVWLTANLPFSADAIAAILSPAHIAAYPVDGRALLARTPPPSNADMGATGWGLPRDILGEPDGSEHSPVPTGIDTMLRLADLTGGKAFVNSNDLTGAIREAVDDAAVLYSLGFYIDAKSADGKFHELKVEVNPKGLTVRYPKGYFAFKDSPSTQDQVHNNWVTAVRSPIESSAIPLEVKLGRVNQPAPNSVSISGTIDVHELRFTEKGSWHEGAVDVTILEQDPAGKVVSQSLNHLALRMTPDQYAAALSTGVRFEKHVELKAGGATLRILVDDPNTALVGSLIIPLSQIQ